LSTLVQDITGYLIFFALGISYFFGIFFALGGIDFLFDKKSHFIIKFLIFFSTLINFVTEVSLGLIASFYWFMVIMMNLEFTVINILVFIITLINLAKDSIIAVNFESYFNPDISIKDKVDKKFLGLLILIIYIGFFVNNSYIGYPLFFMGLVLIGICSVVIEFKYWVQVGKKKK
jgi:hypothetical protein